MFKGKLSYFVLIISIVNLILYHLPFCKFVQNNFEISNFKGFWFVISLAVFMIVLNAIVFYLLLASLHKIGKWLLVILFNINAITLYFMNVYGVIIDEAMIGNVFNAHADASSNFISLTMVLYCFFLGIIPSILILKFKNEYFKLKDFLIFILVGVVLLGGLTYTNRSNIQWVSKRFKMVKSIVLPWSYILNTSSFLHHKYENKEQILLPNAKMKNDKKAVVVLVIGESARSQNFSLYGYKRNTNPLLSEMSDIQKYNAESCATYTRAGSKCILEYKYTDDLYEPLPNYLFRNGVGVYWRTVNWGEPKIKIDHYQKKEDLKRLYGKSEFKYDYDEFLIAGLKQQILESKKNKILIVLHTHTNHGPAYYKKYPSEFNRFTPVCKSPELSNCERQELINAYDNTVLYVDYMLATIIEKLKELKEYKRTMIYISDHGESLGEKNLYMHGLPKSIAPSEQYKIPFIVWSSENSKKTKNQETASQHHIFHSVLDFLDVESPVYDEEMSVFE